MKITNQKELRNLYEAPRGRAKDKVLHKLEGHSIHFIKMSPFAVVSTVSKETRLDASPRGGAPGFVEVLNENQILIPDAKGNNRMDSISNILETGRIGMLFMIPGIDETLRINGSATISTEKKFLKKFTSEKNTPKACIVVTVEEVFLHCAKAFMRSKLWDVGAQIDKTTFPTIGQMLKDQLKSSEAPETREAMVERYKKDL